MTRAALTMAAAVATTAALAAPAHAGVLTKSATDCADPVLSQPFKPWLDSSYYKPVDDFESGADGWTLAGGAKVVDGNAAQQRRGRLRREVAAAARRLERDVARRSASASTSRPCATSPARTAACSRR